MKVLVIGYGSIGRRHTDVLNEMGHDVAVVCRRDIAHPQTYSTLEQALDDFDPEYVVVASRTIEHRDDISQLAASGFRGLVMIEKPIYDSGSAAISNDFKRTKVAFNLRFHPALQKFRDVVMSRDVHAVTAYVGSYLPDWRPDTDYRKSYSAMQNLGGGVLRDLSHELDYLTWIFGPWQKLTALGGHYSSLEIDSDDVFTILFQTTHTASVSLNINYLDTTTRREVIALTASGTVRLDMVAGTVETTDKTHEFSVARNDTYLAQHKAMIDGDEKVICDLTEGLGVMSMIDAAEIATSQGVWVRA